MINKDPKTNNIWMDICVSFNSCHLKQYKNNTPLTLARRICTMVENSEVRKKMFGRSSKSFIFPRISKKNLIQRAIRKRTSIPIENLRASNAKTDSNSLSFVTTFNPNNKNVFALIQTAFKSPKQSDETK